MASVPKKRSRAVSESAASSGPVSNAIIRVTRLHIMRARQLLREIGLHPGQELLMMYLWDMGPQRQSVLVEVFDTDSAAMTRSVQRLEQAGFVRRRPDPTDGRATLVEPTPAGLALRRQVENVWAELERQTVGEMTPAQQRALLRGLTTLEANLQAGR